MHSETRLVTDHPVCAPLVASRLFLNGAATPPSKGGEYTLDPYSPSFTHTFYAALRHDSNHGLQPSLRSHAAPRLKLTIRVIDLTNKCDAHPF
jgi:hypothetical protein